MTNRNDPCSCGSGKKYKKCCGANNRHPIVNFEFSLQSAYQYFQRGELVDCARISREIISSHPSNFDAHHLLGLSELQMNRIQAALPYLEKAVRLAPNNALAKNNLAFTYLQCGRLVDAKKVVLLAIKLESNMADAHNNLGQILLEMLHVDEAIIAFKTAITLQPENEVFTYNLGVALHKHKNDSRAAEILYRRAIELNATFAPALVNLGGIMIKDKRWAHAKEYLERANVLERNNPQLLTNLGLAYQWLGDKNKALSLYQQAIDVSHYPAAYLNLGVLLETLDKKDEAIRNYQAAMSKHPGMMKICAYYLTALVNSKKTDEAYKYILNVTDTTSLRIFSGGIITGVLQDTCAHHKLSNELSEVKQFLHSINMGISDLFNLDSSIDILDNFLLRLNYTDLFSEYEIYQYHLAWGKLATQIKMNPNPPQKLIRKNTKIKIGYISPDFRHHPVGYFIRNIIPSHNKSKFEIYCYSLSKKQDALTNSIMETCDHFIPAADLDDAKLAQRIHADHLDILIHLAGHTLGGRIQILSSRPAPIQILYLGYPNSSGADFIDYWITDPYAHTDEDQLHSEELLRLPESFLCFGAFADCEAATQPPVVDAGVITFGSFNNLAKLSPTTVRIWSMLLNSVPNARLLLKSGDLKYDLVKENIKRIFGEHGVDEHRLQFSPMIDTREKHLEYYNNIDIALDPIPYNGTTTTCEALWMGVPVLTLVGQVHRQRVGYSILKNIGVEDTIAYSEQEFVGIAKHFASNLEALKTLRKRVAVGIRKSILCDPQRFTRQFEAALEGVYREHLKKEDRAFPRPDLLPQGEGG